MRIVRHQAAVLCFKKLPPVTAGNELVGTQAVSEHEKDPNGKRTELAVGFEAQSEIAAVALVAVEQGGRIGGAQESIVGQPSRKIRAQDEVEGRVLGQVLGRARELELAEPHGQPGQGMQPQIGI